MRRCGPRGRSAGGRRRGGAGGGRRLPPRRPPPPSGGGGAPGPPPPPPPRPRRYPPEEIDLALALAQQVVLALELARLGEQDRQAIVLAERNRMARDIHDTLAQGFTGIV